MDAILEKFLDDYKTPSFGSLSKKEIDLRIFELYIDAGIIKKDPSIFDLVNELKISRSKARSLIYDYNLRKKSEDMLKEDLKNLLKDGVVEKDDRIKIEVDDPYLSDYIRNILKSNKMIADGSFMKEILVLSTKAYCTLLENSLTDEEANATKKSLFGDSIAKSVMNGFMYKFLEKRVGENTAKNILELGKMIVEQKGQGVKKMFERYIENVDEVEG